MPSPHFDFRNTRKCELKPQGEGICKIMALRLCEESLTQQFGNVLHPWGIPIIIKHKTNIMVKFKHM